MKVSADQILAVARSELGYRESPANSNRTKFGEAYGLDGQPWCVMFVWWVFQQAGAANMLPMKTASCGALMRAAQASGMWVKNNFQLGDIAIFDFPGGAATDHCGIIEAITDSGVLAIEGNTSATDQANGGQVMRRSRSWNVIKGAVRPSYLQVQKEADMNIYTRLADVPEKFRPIISKLMTAGIILGDGSDPTGNNDIINLSHEQVRTLVFIYRGGGFDKKLLAENISPALE